MNDPKANPTVGLSSKGDSPFRQEQLNCVEDRCSRLSEFVVENDRRLKDILNPNQVSTVDYMEQSFINPAASLTVNKKSLENQGSRANYEGSVSPGSAYYTTSTSKAKFLVGIYSRASPNISHVTRDSLDGSDPFELERKKLELIASLSRKLKILEEERKAIQEELGMNENLGLTIEDWLYSTSASDYQREKFRLHVEDTEKITRLLLKLSGQIARVENALNKLPPDTYSAEKDLLCERKGRLLQQKEDASSLRKSLERRGEMVLGFLGDVFTEEQLGDYQYFIQMKRKLLVDACEIEDKIKLGMEQKEALEKSLHNNNTADQSGFDLIS